MIPENFSIFELVKDMRTQRPSVVQTKVTKMVSPSFAIINKNENASILPNDTFLLLLLGTI